VLAIGMVAIFSGYTVASYGWVLLKGWDIPFRAWVSPLHPYTWPADGAAPPPVPASQLFPSSASTAASTDAASGGGAATPAAPPRPQPRGKSVLP